MNPQYSTAQPTDFDDTRFEIPTRKGEAIGGTPWRLPTRLRVADAPAATSATHETSAHDATAHDECGAVARALTDTHWDFRTVRGIATETGLAEDVVKHILDEHQLGRKPWGRVVDDRYTAKDRPVSSRERLSLFTSYVAKRPR